MYESDDRGQEELGPTDDRIIAEAKRRCKEGLDWESYARDRWVKDVEFAHADNINGYQWPDAMRAERDKQSRPWLTINKTRQHCLLIKNDAKKNKPRIAARPVGGQASYRSAAAYNAIFRGIEQASRAQEVYTIATDHMVEGGWGYFRIVSDYKAFDSDEQQIFIRPINDPLTVVMDYTIEQPDGSDAEWCIIFKDYPEKEFKKLHPEWMQVASARTTLDQGAQESWGTVGTTRVAEYFRRKHIKDTLITYNDNGEKKSFLKSAMPKLIIDKLMDEDILTSRPTERIELEWFLVVGDEIKQKQMFPCKYIPVVRVVAEEFVINGKVDRPGHVRALRDPQRIYNYWATAATEYAALQTKVPWLAAMEAIEGQIDVYASANNSNPSVLPWHAFMEDGITPIPKPERVMPPQAAPAYLEGMKSAMQDMAFVSGQYSAMLGEPSNERSANAITTRQRQGDTATYHYIDGLARAIRHAGVIIMDMIPHVYDTKRVLYAIQPDGSTLDLTVDPMAKEHYQENLEAASAILNPRLGQYEVESDIGPDFGTKREETFNALTTILTQAPQMATMIGDLLMQSADFDLADEAAARLRRAVPKNILGLGPSPEEQALQQQLALLTQKMQGMQELTVKTIEENSKLRVILHGKNEQRDIDLYDSETKRLAAVIKMIPPEQLAPIIAQLGSDTLKTQLSSWIDKANEGVGDDQITQPNPLTTASPQPIQNPGVLPQANNGNG